MRQGGRNGQMTPPNKHGSRRHQKEDPHPTPDPGEPARTEEPRSLDITPLTNEVNRLVDAYQGTHKGDSENIKKNLFWSRIVALGTVIAAVGAIVYSLIAYHQWEEMQISNRNSQDALILVQRARFSFNGITTDLVVRRTPEGDQKSWKFWDSWKNNGLTPATGIVGAVTADEIPEEPNEVQFINERQARGKYVSGISISQGDSLQVGPIIKDKSFLPTPAEASANPDRHLFFWGWIAYHDVFQDTKTHVTEFCNRVLNVQETVATRMKPPEKGRSDDSFIHAGPVLDLGVCKKQNHNCIDENCPDYAQIVELAEKLK